MHATGMPLDYRRSRRIRRPSGDGRSNRLASVPTPSIQALLPGLQLFAFATAREYYSNAFRFAQASLKKKSPLVFTNGPGKESVREP